MNGRTNSKDKNNRTTYRPTTYQHLEVFNNFNKTLNNK